MENDKIKVRETIPRLITYQHLQPLQRNGVSMSKRIRNVLIFIIILSVIVSLAILGKINSRLTVNPPEYAGNTGGNLYNRGLFTEDDTYIYFANPADNFHLYRMDKDL